MHTRKDSVLGQMKEDLLNFARNYCTLARRGTPPTFCACALLLLALLIKWAFPRNRTTFTVSVCCSSLALLHKNVHDPTLSLAMAVAPDFSHQNLEELEREITCAVCYRHYQEAKLLPCNHYYCRACIETLAKGSRRRPFPCPECRKDSILPSGGVEQLQSAFFVERMKDVHGKLATVAGKVEATCECCSEGKAVAFCRQCTDFIRAECVTQHRKMKQFAGHKVTTLEDLKKGGVKDVPLKEAPPPKCEEHDELKKIFCLDCNRLVCRDCTVIDHNGHSYNFLKKYATEARKTLMTHSLH